MILPESLLRFGTWQFEFLDDQFHVLLANLHVGQFGLLRLPFGLVAVPFIVDRRQSLGEGEARQR